MRYARAMVGGLVFTSVCFVGFVGRSEGVTTVISLVNPSFEADGTGVASPTGWQSSGDVNTDYTEFTSVELNTIESPTLAEWSRL